METGTSGQFNGNNEKVIFEKIIFFELINSHNIQNNNVSSRYNNQDYHPSNNNGATPTSAYGGGRMGRPKKGASGQMGPPDPVKSRSKRQQGRHRR